MQTIVAIAGEINLTGQRVATSRSGQNLVVSGIPGQARGVIVPSGLGLKEGEELLGTCQLATATYDTDAAGVKLDTPIVRVEMSSFTSLDAKAKFNRLSGEINLEKAMVDAKIKALAKVEFKASDFFAPVAADAVGAA